MSTDTPSTRRRLLVLGAITAVPAAAWWRTATTSTVTSDPVSTSSVSSLPAPLPPTAPPPPSAGSSSEPPFDHALEFGMAEAKVVIVQDRLRAAGFDPGPSDGIFGSATLGAVWAFEKLVLGVASTEVTGVVDETMWARLHDDVAIRPRRTLAGTHVEVYLPEQAAVVFSESQPVVATHVSSGAGVDWCDEVTVDNDDGTTETKGICGRSITPAGVFHVERKVDGWRNAPLGRLYKPVYFNYGIALHGASNVPDEPASRGCVRLPMHVADHVPDLLAVGDAVYVFDGIEEPEHYGAQLPVFDWPDPNDTPPTTTSASTTSSVHTDTP